ncbi:MAG: flagellar biosynthetic protein FliR [Myxococcales bacterium]|jgi:flagellar biosynthetic protein FliR
MQQTLQELGVHVNVSNVLLIWALLMARVMPLILLAPFMGGDVVPAPVKMGIGIALSVLLYPLLADTPIPPGSITFVLLMLKEIFVGLAIAFTASIAFQAAQAAGTFADNASGANMATVFVPQIQSQATLFASFKFQLTVIIFLALNGHHVVIQALFHSFEVIPLDAWPRFGHGFWPLFELVIRMTAHLLIVAVALAAPAVIAVFIVDLSLGLINRIAPQIQVFFISMSIKPMVVTLMTLLALLVVYDRLVELFKWMLARVNEVVGLFA